jgi:hypothetical protein
MLSFKLKYLNKFFLFHIKKYNFYFNMLKKKKLLTLSTPHKSKT